jgi:Amt family ammonium transporter
VGGIAGTICLGFFASTAVNPGGVDGLFFGNPSQVGTQLLGVVVVAGYAFVISWILFKVIHGTLGMRLAEDAEVQGMDSTEHSETAYNN